MLRLVKYNDGLSIHNLWYWVDEEDRIDSPIFETEHDALNWEKHKLIK